MSIVKVIHQGAPMVNLHGVYWRKYDEVVLFEVDMMSKWCRVSGHGPDNMIMIVPQEESLHLMNGVDKDEPTDIEFIGYEKGWDIFLAQVSRYTLRVCFVRQDVESVMWNGS